MVDEMGSVATGTDMNGLGAWAEPFFSVVVPLYNKREFVENTVATVMGQTRSRWELIIVDDGSSDGSGELVKRFEDPRIRVIEQGNAGVSAARNRGIREARGTFVCFLDADDEWSIHHLEELEALAAEFPQARMLFSAVAVRRHGKLSHDAWCAARGEGERGLLPSYPQAMVASPNLINSSNVAIAREVLTGSGALRFDERDAVGEDLDLWLKVSLSHPVAYSTSVGSIYNRDTEANARSRNAVHYPRGYFATIEAALASPAVSDDDKRALLHVRDRKMVAYVFSLIESGMKADARAALESWKPESGYARVYPMLYAALMMPTGVSRSVRLLRAKAF